MNLANRLTAARFFLTLFFVAALSCGFPYCKTLALFLFVLAGVTDYADGMVARRYSLVTDFGKLMDPLIDKIMMAAAYICLVPLGAIPAWAVVIIISREFLITGLRLLALSRGSVLAAEALGKHKTGWQIATVIYFLALLSLKELWRWKTAAPAWYLAAWFDGGATLITITIALTLISGAGYLWKNRALLDSR